MLRNNLFFVSNCWKSRGFFQFKNSGLALRFVSTNHLSSNDYIQALYNKLSSKEKYQFLDQNVENNEALKTDEKLTSSREFKDFLNILAKSDDAEVSSDELSEIQALFSEKFQDWTRVSQLRVGFLMHLDKRINSSEYLTKVIRHMCSVNFYQAGPHDLTALLLLIYFKRDLTVDDLSEYLDLEVLQSALSLKIKKNELSQDEICAVCLGFKRIADMKISVLPLRKALYDEIGRISATDNQLADFFVMTLITTLSKGNMVFMDDPEVVHQTLRRLESQVEHLKLDTVIKIMTFPLTLGFSNKMIEENVFSRMESNIGQLETWDLLQICNYISKQPSSFEVANQIVIYLENKLDDLKNVEELMDIIECFHYLSHLSHYSKKFNDIVFAAINSSWPGKSFKEDTDFLAVTKDVASRIMTNFGAAENADEIESLERNINKTISIFTRIPAFISSCYRIETGEKDNLIEPNILDVINKSQHKRLPLELYAPQMSIKRLDKRSKQLVNCHKILVEFFGTELYVGVTRILPHFTEPDLVFGNIAGNCLTIPTWLTDAEFVGFRRPPPGDWYVLVIGTRKSHDFAGNVVGQEAAKVKQLEKLGYNPFVISYGDLGSRTRVMNSLVKLLKANDVELPNLDDGVGVKTRKF